MQYALYIPPFGPYSDPHTLAALARDAEDAGWDGFFIWDHMEPGWNAPVADPWVALAAVALNTSRIRIGALVTPLPRRRPHKVARETVTLDHLSGGRLIFGVGTGLGTGEWDDLGEEADVRVRGKMLDEGLEVLAGLWSGEPFTHAGLFYRIKNAAFLPRPVQEPRIPIWVAGFWPHKLPMRRAAQWDGVFPLFNERDDAELQAMRDMAAFIREERGDREGPFDVIYAGRPTPGDDKAQAAEIVDQTVRAGGFTWWLENIVPDAFGGVTGGQWPLGPMRERVLQGPPKA